MEIKQRLISILDTVLSGHGSDGGPNEIVYYCPFCNHHKQKLQINVMTQQWHCWVCDAKGKSIFSLAKKVNAPKSIFSELSQIFNTVTNNTFDTKEKSKIVKLPDEFQILVKREEKISSIAYIHARSYLLRRHINEEDIIRYNIGYCVDGNYGGRIIVPSYDCNGILNYFVARSFYNSPLKYKNPPVSKNTVIFELYINWNMPIILCEGVFDAMAIKKNAIPLLGKTVQESLLKKLVKNNVQEVIIILDSDAGDTMIKVCNRLMKYNINVSRISLEESDPSDLGFRVMNNIIATKKIDVSEYDLILQKINL
jgi:DNA primase